MPIKYHKVTYITAALQGFQKLIYVGVINVFDIYHEGRPHALMIQMIGTRSAKLIARLQSSNVIDLMSII